LPTANAMLCRILQLLVLGAALSSTAGAADPAKAWYVGAGAGQSRGTQYCDAQAGTVVQNCDDQGNAWKLFVGYQINQYVGVEGGYIDFGKFSSNLAVAGAPGTDETKARAGFLEAVAGVPIGERVFVFGKVGGAYWRIKSDTQAGSTLTKIKENGLDAMFGAGAQVFVTKNLAIRAEYEYLPNFGNDTTGELDMQVISASVLWRF